MAQSCARGPAYFGLSSWSAMGFAGAARSCCHAGAPARSTNAVGKAPDGVRSSGAVLRPIHRLDGKEYVGLADPLEPLGNVEAREDGKKWKLRFAPRPAAERSARNSRREKQRERFTDRTFNWRESFTWRAAGGTFRCTTSGQCFPSSLDCKPTSGKVPCDCSSAT